MKKACSTILLSLCLLIPTSLPAMDGYSYYAYSSSENEYVPEEIKSLHIDATQPDNNAVMYQQLFDTFEAHFKILMETEEERAKSCDLIHSLTHEQLTDAGRKKLHDFARMIASSFDEEEQTISQISALFSDIALHIHPDDRIKGAAHLATLVGENTYNKKVFKETTQSIEVYLAQCSEVEKSSLM